MRNTTKLKAVLLKYTAELEMNDDKDFTVTLRDKTSGETAVVRATNYSSAVAKAYSHLLRVLREEEAPDRDLH